MKKGSRKIVCELADCLFFSIFFMVFFYFSY